MQKPPVPIPLVYTATVGPLKPLVKYTPMANATIGLLAAGINSQLNGVPVQLGGSGPSVITMSPLTVASIAVMCPVVPSATAAADDSNDVNVNKIGAKHLR
jgi:hypothetical protein